jgi:hypothetical protein
MAVSPWCVMWLKIKDSLRAFLRGNWPALVAVGLAVGLAILSAVYHWRWPPWAYAVIGFLGPSFAFGLLNMWLNREVLVEQYEMAKTSFSVIKASSRAKKAVRKAKAAGLPNLPKIGKY